MVKEGRPLGPASDALMQPCTSKIVALLKPKRRWFRFSLGTMLMVMLLLSAWMGQHVNSTRLQRQSVAAINECGDSAVGLRT